MCIGLNDFLEFLWQRDIVSFLCYQCSVEVIVPIIFRFFDAERALEEMTRHDNTVDLKIVIQQDTSERTYEVYAYQGKVVNIYPNILGCLVEAWDLRNNKLISVKVKKESFGKGYHSYSTIQDGTNEIMAKYHEFIESNKIKPGKMVEVTKGNKVPKGTKGLCFYAGTSATWGTKKVGISPSGILTLVNGRKMYMDAIFLPESYCKVCWSEDKNLSDDNDI